jgi:hypothetical protein
VDPDYLEHIVFIRDVKCKYCKRRGFHWEQDSSGWRLKTKSGLIHKCKAHKEKEECAWMYLPRENRR